MAKPRIQLRRPTPLPLRWIIGMVIGVIALFGLGWWMEDTLKTLFAFDTQSVAVVSNAEAFPPHVHVCVLGPDSYAWFMPTEADTTQWPGAMTFPDSLTLTQLQADTTIILGSTGLRIEDLLTTAQQLSPPLPYQLSQLNATHLRVIAKRAISN